jgi:hypothetical protein
VFPDANSFGVETSVRAAAGTTACLQKIQDGAQSVHERKVDEFRKTEKLI